MAVNSQTIGADKLCQLTGLNDQAHRRLALDGYFPVPIKHQYQLVPTLQGLFRKHREADKSANIFFDSIKNAAAWTGYPVAIFKRAKQSGCEAFIGSRIDLQKLLRWMASAQSDASNELPVGFATWAEVFNQFKAGREEIRLNKEKKSVVDIAEVSRLAAAAEGYYFSELERAQRELPAMLAGLDPAGVRDELHKFFKTLRERSREKFAAVAK